MTKPFQETILNLKPHFHILDGLRGVAAIAVVIFHFMEFVSPDITKNFIGHGFLAVDFFFCLSGFVIAYAYDQRLSEIGVWEFVKSRLIRLHPMVVFGSVLGLIGLLLDPFINHLAKEGVGNVVLIFLSSIFLIPFPVMESRLYNLFSLNAPSWSLFWEYIANIIYAVFLFRIKPKLLYLLIFMAAIILAYLSYKSSNLMGGWGGPTFWDGAARIFYSFLVGLIIYRLKLKINSKIGFFGLSLMLLLAFLMPFFTYNWLAELLVVLIYFPFIICLGAGSRLSLKTTKICIFSGNISYPLYMIHYTAIWFFGDYYSHHKVSTIEVTFIISISTLLLIALAHLVLKVYDIPVCKYLNRKRKLIKQPV